LGKAPPDREGFPGYIKPPGVEPPAGLARAGAHCVISSLLHC
jgi:hypothetical protein